MDEHLTQRLQLRLQQRQQQDRYRQRQTLQSAQGAEVMVNGSNLINFCSNDYLGLANHPALQAAAKTAVDNYGVGSGASHLVCGHSAEHHALEQELAEFTGREQALLFSTGYMANMGVLNALLTNKDVVLQDKLNHASLIDGGLLSGAKFKRFLHNDMASLSAKLSPPKSLHHDSNTLVAVDSVFSMDGDIAPLNELAQITANNNAWLMCDDAHGFGVLGENGKGAAEHFGLNQQQLPIYMATLGKAAGGYGAFVAGSEALIESLIQFSRSYIYTTAMPAAVAAANRQSIKLIAEESWRRDQLNEYIAYFTQSSVELGLPLMTSATAIQPLLIGDDAKAMQLSQQLANKGLWVSAIRPPTVPEGSARLRITLSAAHSKTHITQLLDALAELMP